MDVRLLKYALKSQKARNVYIGSGEKARNLPRSPLAMPYELRIMWTGNTEKDEKDRNEKIAQYKIWLWKVMRNPNDPRHAAVWSELRRLREDSILLCYCYPRNCHGHVIVAAWSWARENGKLDIPRAEPPMQQTMTNAEDLKTLETQARANLTKETTTVKRHGDKGKDRTVTVTPALLPKHTAPGPLDMMSIMDRLGASLGADLVDKKLDEEILAAHVTTCPDCDAPKYIHLAHHHADCACEGCHYDRVQPEQPMDDTLMADDLPTPPVPTKPRTTRRPRITYTDPRGLQWNRIDDMLLDLADLAPVIAKHEAQDRAFDRAEIRYEREQLALVCHESVSEVA